MEIRKGRALGNRWISMFLVWMLVFGFGVGASIPSYASALGLQGYRSQNEEHRDITNTSVTARDDTESDVEIKKADARDGDAISIHVDEDVQVHAVSKNARYLGSEFLFEDEQHQAMLDFEMVDERDVLIRPKQTGIVTMRSTFETESGEKVQTNTSIVVYSNLVFDFNDKSGDIYRDENPLYPSKNADGYDAKTDEIEIGIVNFENKTGYTLLGWSTKPDGSGVNFLTGDTLKTGIYTSDLVLYAIWNFDETMETTKTYDDSVVETTSVSQTMEEETAASAQNNTPNEENPISDAASNSESNEERNQDLSEEWNPESNVDSKEIAQDLPEGIMYRYDTSYHVNKQESTSTSRNDTGAVTSVSDRIDVKMYLLGEAPLEEPEFKALLVGVSENAPMPTHTSVSRVGAGSMSFGEITFTSPGIYKYRVTQDTSVTQGYIWDLSEIEITYLVSLAEQKLQYSKTVSRNKVHIRDIDFTNQYRLPRLTVHFDTNGASDVVEDQEIAAGGYVAKPMTPKKLGYVFSDWTCDGEVFEFTTPITSSMTLVANWEEKTHLVEFRDALDANEGSADLILDVITVVHGDEAKMPVIPDNKTGYHFLKWDKSTRNIVDDQVLHAVYEPNIYTVCFSGNALGVNGITPNVHHSYDVDYPLPLNGFTREGYIFAGWSTINDGEVVYQNGETVRNLNAANNGFVMLYAVWEPIQKEVENIDTNSNETEAEEKVQSTEKIAGWEVDGEIETRFSDAMVMNAIGVKREDSIVHYHISEDGRGVLTRRGVEMTIVSPKDVQVQERIEILQEGEKEPDSESDVSVVWERGKTNAKQVPKTSDGLEFSYLASIGVGFFLICVYLRRKSSKS